MIHRLWIGFWMLGCTTIVAAPVPKGKEAEPPPATDQQRDQAQNNLRLIMLAFHNYESAYQSFPGDILDKNKKPLLSWRVAILPYLDDDGGPELFKQFAIDEPWDSKTNKPLIAKMHKYFAPVRVKAEEGHTFYRGFTGNGTAFVAGKRNRIADITDGTSNSIGIIEAGEAVIWTKPDEMPFTPTNPPSPRCGRPPREAPVGPPAAPAARASSSRTANTGP